MAKILFGGVVSDARKKLGGIVFTKGRFGAVVRKKVSPVQPRSNAQRGVRANFTGNSKAWSGTLTSAQRQAYINLAAANPKKDRFGNSMTLTGAQLFNSLSRNLHTCALNPLTTAPTGLSVDDPAGITVSELAAIAAVSISAVADASGGSNSVTAVAAASGGVATYTGTFTDGAANGCLGMTFVMAGFTNAVNNGTFVCTASTGTTLTLENPQAVAESGGSYTVNSATWKYSGTFSTGAGNALVGQQFTLTTFTKAGNNGTFNCTLSTGTYVYLTNPNGAATDTGSAVGNKSLVLKTTNTPAAGDYVVITATAPKNAGRTSLGKSYRIIQALPAATPQPLPLQTAYVSKWGAPVTGQTLNIGGYLISGINGASGKPYTAAFAWS
jgi:hypothetical protein